jgi:hypothetical protein
MPSRTLRRLLRPLLFVAILSSRRRRRTRFPYFADSVPRSFGYAATYAPRTTSRSSLWRIARTCCSYADSLTAVPARSSLGAPPITLSYIPETAAPLRATAAPLLATTAAVWRRAGVPHLAEGPLRAAVLRPAEAAALPGGLYLRRSSLRLRFLHSIFSAGQTWHASSTGQAYLTTQATIARQVRSCCLDCRATPGPNQRSRPAGPSPFASHLASRRLRSPNRRTVNLKVS